MILDMISGNTPFIFNKIEVFSKLAGISPLIFQHSEINSLIKYSLNIYINQKTPNDYSKLYENTKIFTNLVF
jgi:hypothetical protein